MSKIVVFAFVSCGVPASASRFQCEESPMSKTALPGSSCRNHSLTCINMRLLLLKMMQGHSNQLCCNVVESNTRSFVAYILPCLQMLYSVATYCTYTRHLTCFQHTAARLLLLLLNSAIARSTRRYQCKCKKHSEVLMQMYHGFSTRNKALVRTRNSTPEFLHPSPFLPLFPS